MRTTQTQKSTQASVPQMGFEPTTPMLEGAKTVHAFDQVTTVFSCTMAAVNGVHVYNITKKAFVKYE
jgi:hypothetical protein